MPSRTPLPELRSAREKALVEFVSRAGVTHLDQLVDRFFREEHETLLDARPRADAALKRLVLKGYLNARPVVVDGVEAKLTGNPLKVIGRHYFTRAYCLTPRTSWEFNLPLPPTLRESFTTHHMKTLDAITHVEKAHYWSGHRVLDFKMETQLVRESFRGKVFDGNQEAVPMLPDARLTIQTPEGEVREVNVEYVSSKYTDEMIRQKHQAFTHPTVWAVPNASTAARVKSITGQEAVIV